MSTARAAEARREAKKIALWVGAGAVAPMLTYAAAASTAGGNWWSVLLSPVIIIGAIVCGSLTKMCHEDMVMDADEVPLVFLAWALVLIFAAITLGLVGLAFWLPFVT